MMEAPDLVRAIRRKGGIVSIENEELRVWGAPKILAKEALAQSQALLRQLRAEETLVSRWVANRVSAGAEFCQHCKLPFAPGSAFVDVPGSDGAGRFHQTCLPEWRAAMEREARRVLGFGG
jgi:hypothetical protein